MTGSPGLTSPRVSTSNAAGAAPALTLGTTANLLYGYRAVWDRSDPASTPLFAPSKHMLQTFAPSFEPVQGAWSNPYLSFHPSAASLVSTLFEYSVVAASDEASPPTIPSGPLVVGDRDSRTVLQTLSSILGVNLADPTLSFVLVQRKRRAGSATHPAVKDGVFTGRSPRSNAMKQEYRLAILRRLKTGRINVEQTMTGRFAVGTGRTPDPSHDDIAGYFGFFDTYGTHYVSKIDFGDAIFQVFAYHAPEFAEIRAIYPPDSPDTRGPDAVRFRHFTSGLYVAPGGHGRILSLSNDPALARSVKAGDWDDPRDARTDSIFQSFAREFSVDVNASFTQVVPTRFELSPLASFADADQRQVWYGVFKAAMYQKYGDGIQPAFTMAATYDYKAIFPEDSTTFVSTIATPAIDVYQTRTDLSKLQMVAPEVVNDFTAFAQVLQVTAANAPIAIPGKNVALVAHAWDLAATAGNIAVLQFRDDAYDSVQIACQEFAGPLVLVNRSGTRRNVIVDGERYKLADSTVYPQRYAVAPDADVRQAPARALVPRLITDVNFSLTQAQVLLEVRTLANPATMEQGRSLITKYLNWIAFAIPEDTTDPELLELRVRAFYLARVSAKLKLAGMHVPYLRYATYQPLVEKILGVVETANRQMMEHQQQIRARKQAELTIDVATQLNENIIRTGKLLSGLISANAAQESDLAQYYGEILAQKQESLVEATEEVKKLGELLHSQQQVVDERVREYRTAARVWANAEIYRFVMDVAQNLFAAGFTLLVPAVNIESVKALGETAQKIQKLVTLFSDLDKLYKTVREGLSGLHQAQVALSSVGFDGATFPTSLEWSEFSVNFSESLEQGPPIPEKTALKAAFDILVLRGQALLTAQTNIQSITGDIYMYQQQQLLSQAQQKRLSALNDKLDPTTIRRLDTSSIDLIGLTGSLQLLSRQMLSMLASTLAIQDQALQYEYLQAPTPMRSFDLLSLQRVMAEQQHSILRGLTIQPPPQQLPKPIAYIVTVPTDRIVNGDPFCFNIFVSAPQFFDYAMVRVTHVVGSMTGVASTNSGNFELDLMFTGTPFQDRDGERNILTFNTIARKFNYLYDARTGAAKFGANAGSWAPNISNVTPFGTWQISLPLNAANAGITFSKPTVEVTLTFFVTALLRVPRSRAAMAGLTLAAIPGTAKLPEDAVYSNMHGPGTTALTVLNGWDVVLSMTEEKVNAVLAAQYAGRADNPDFFYTIPVQTETSQPDPDTEVKTQTTLGLVFGAVKVRFLPGSNNDCEVTLPILSGTYGHSVIPPMMKPVEVTRTQPLKVTPGMAVVGRVPLSKVGGQISGERRTSNVILDFAEGSFGRVRIVEDTTQASVIDDIIATYLREHRISYLINIIDLSDRARLDSLTPRMFQLATSTTRSGRNILQVFITTTGNPQSHLGINLADPIPTGNDCSLLIKSSILFESIFPRSFTSRTTDAITKVEPETPDNPDQVAYSARVAEGEAKLTFVPTRRIRISGTSNDVTLDLRSMRFTPTAEGKLTASYASTFAQPFQYENTEILGDPPISRTTWVHTSLNVTVKFMFPMPLALGGDGGNQKVTIESNPAQVKIDGAIDSNGPCSCGDADVQELLLAGLREQLPKKLIEAVNVKFGSVSVFALQNLLFPARNIINFTAAGVPGDLAIFGTIDPPASPS